MGGWGWRERRYQVLRKREIIRGRRRRRRWWRKEDDNHGREAKNQISPTWSTGDSLLHARGESNGAPVSRRCLRLSDLTSVRKYIVFEREWKQVSELHMFRFEYVSDALKLNFSFGSKKKGTPASPSLRQLDKSYRVITCEKAALCRYRYLLTHLTVLLSFTLLFVHKFIYVFFYVVLFALKVIYRRRRR